MSCTSQIYPLLLFGKSLLGLARRPGDQTSLPAVTTQEGDVALQKASKLLEDLEQDVSGQDDAKQVVEAMAGDNILHHKDKVHHFGGICCWTCQVSNSRAVPVLNTHS